MRFWINAIGFQLGWWVCVLGVAQNLQGQAMALSAALILGHLLTCGRPREELVLMVAVTLAGIAMDSVLQAWGVLQFMGWHWGPLSPFWLWVLWAMFAFTLNHSLRWLQTIPVWGVAAIGALLGPLSYWAGANMGAADWNATGQNLSVLALSWAIMTPVVVTWARRLLYIAKP